MKAEENDMMNRAFELGDLLIDKVSSLPLKADGPVAVYDVRFDAMDWPSYQEDSPNLVLKAEVNGVFLIFRIWSVWDAEWVLHRDQEEIASLLRIGPAADELGYQRLFAISHLMGVPTQQEFQTFFAGLEERTGRVLRAEFSPERYGKMITGVLQAFFRPDDALALADFVGSPEWRWIWAKADHKNAANVSRKVLRLVGRISGTRAGEALERFLSNCSEDFRRIIAMRIVAVRDVLAATSSDRLVS